MRLLICIVVYTLFSLCNNAYGRVEDIREYIEKDISTLSKVTQNSDRYISELNRLLALCHNNFEELDTTTSKVYYLFHRYYFNDKNFIKALEFQKSELRIIKVHGSKKSLADAYTSLGDTYRWLSEYYESENCYLKGLEIKRKIPDHTFFENYIGLCTSYAQQGKYNLLIEYAKYAQEVSKTPEQNCKAYYELMRAHIYLNQYDLAEELADKMIELGTAHNLKYCLGKAYTGKGWITIERQDALKKVNRSKKKYEVALNYYFGGIDLIESSGHKYKERSLAYNYSVLSNIYRRLNKHKESIAYGNRAIDISKAFYGKDYNQDMGTLFANLSAKYGDRFAIERKKVLHQNLPVSKCTSCLSDVNNTIKYQYEAIKCFLGKESYDGEILEYNKEDMYAINLKKRCITSITNLARAYALKYYYLSHDEDDLINAEKNISLAVDLIDIMRSEMSSKETKMLWRRSTKSRYDDGVAIAEWMQDINKMLYYMEKSKSILLLEELNHQEALSLIPEQLAKREEQLREKISDNLNKTPKDYNIYNTFLDSIQDAYPSYYEYKFDITPPTVSEIQENILDDSTAVVMYYNTGDSIYTLNITKDQSEILTQKPQEINKDIETILGYLNNKDSLEFQKTYDDFVGLAHDLHNRLFEPIKNKRKYTIVVADGMMEYLPFDVLVKSIDEKGRPHYLIQDHVFSNTSSISVLQKKKVKTQNNFNTMLMVCPQRFDDMGLAPLTYSKKEISLLKNFAETDILEEENASLKNFIDKSENYDVIHFSSHSGLNHETKQPWIAFQDSLISLNEIYKLELNSSLVTLSSCKSFDGDYNTQEGINSLARAFLFADVSAVVGSLWNLNEASGLEIFREFYINLKKSDTKSAALRNAKLKFIENHPYKSPYHWASLVIIGNPEGLQQNVTSDFKTHLLIGVLVLVFFLIYKFKFK